MAGEAARKREGARERKASLSDEVYEKLLAKLVGSELVPGHIINRREVAEELGVSVAPVLEAFLRLERDGYVETIPRKGTLVRPVQKDDFFEQLVMREAIECEAARLYCGAPVREDRARLEPLARRIDEAEAGAPGRWNFEIEFHGELVSLARCKVLDAEFLRTIRLGTFYNMHRIFIEMYRTGGEYENQSHADLLDKLERDDPDYVEGVVRDHLRSGNRRLFVDRMR
ncbi:MAG TPA: GntR family transcriptional regulator [Spirochaetales bacterium]|nr:GntR family transcriptional regulator [Spirochaetales bacterium]HRY55769.1 GntR family transcriptional regulator [Spirochaetia bacterium]HRZ63348.1 GntR family transcriptional regulator [Spirochaetia bacterium]